MRKLWIVMLGLLMSVFVTTVNATIHHSPIGYWKQYDDKTGQLQSLMKIWRSEKGDIRGKVVTGYEINHKPPRLFCTGCDGKHHNQRIAGMTILWGMWLDNGYWQKGRILDPNSGDIYHAQMRLKHQGNQLDVRGYIGILLFGRSQTWVRLPKKQFKAMLAKGYPQPKVAFKKS
jgi:uncharacterized protein (DUF2147 family)